MPQQQSDFQRLRLLGYTPQQIQELLALQASVAARQAATADLPRTNAPAPTATDQQSINQLIQQLQNPGPQYPRMGGGAQPMGTTPADPFMQAIQRMLSQQQPSVPGWYGGAGKGGFNQ